MFFILKKTKENKKCHSPMIIADNLKERKKGHRISNVYFALIWFYHVSTKLEKLERPELNYAMIHILFFYVYWKCLWDRKRICNFPQRGSSARIGDDMVSDTVLSIFCAHTTVWNKVSKVTENISFIHIYIYIAEQEAHFRL